jgi:type VI secretion system secreted protein VgrG
MQLRQEGRPVRVQTDLGPDALVVERMVAEEFVSAPFRISLDLLSTTPDHPTKGMLRTPVVVEMDIPGGVRYFHGVVSRFSQGGRMGEVTRYRCEVVPWLAYLGQSGNCRIFQQKTVPEIVEEVLKGAGVAKFKLSLTGSYDKRDYCVQFGESNLHFVSRLLEDEGIFYYFTHAKSGHEMVIGNQNSVFATIKGAGQVRVAGQEVSTAPDVVKELLRESAVHVGKVTLRDYNYLQPSAFLESSVEGPSGEEIYAYPGGFQTRAQGDRRVRLRLEAAEALEHTAYGQGSVRAFTAGGRFTLRDHWDSSANKEYVVTSVRHTAVQAGWRAGESETFSYENEFAAILFSVPYRPQLHTPRPQMRGMQTAVVVGPRGEEIYTDAHGRVKVHFHWDREGKKDEKSSCWVRVSSAWAGKGWGAVHIPRIGQEVVVDFLDGDPDQPIIVGRVYNGEQTPPYALPANMTQSGIKSRSTKTGGQEDFNELRFEDKKGTEEVYLHAQKDFRRIVENDETAQVLHDQTETITNHRTITLKEGNDALTIEKGNRDVKIAKGDHTFAVVEGKHTATIKMDHTTTVEQGNRSVIVKMGNDSHQVDTGNRTVKVKTGNHQTEVAMGNHETKVSTGNLKTEVSMGNVDTKVDMGNVSNKLMMGNYTIQAALGKVTIEAMQEIELKVGASVVKISQMGVEVKGMMTKLEGMVQTDVKGLMTNVQGQAITAVKGAITMIN